MKEYLLHEWLECLGKSVNAGILSMQEASSVYDKMCNIINKAWEKDYKRKKSAAIAGRSLVRKEKSSGSKGCEG